MFFVYYRSYLEASLSYSEAVKRNQLKCAGFEEDEDEMDEIDPIGDGVKNSGIKQRWLRTKFGKSFECIGKIHGEIFEQKKLLLNRVSLGVKLERNDSSFVLMSKGAAGTRYTILIEKAILYVTVKKIAPWVREAHESRLLTTNAKYPMRKIKMKFFTRGADRSDLSEPNLLSGQLPQKIIIGMCDTRAFNGDLKRNPFNFQHFNVSEIALTQNGQDIPFKPLNMNFENESLVGYYQLMQSLGLWNSNITNGIDPYKHYKKGYTLFGVNFNFVEGDSFELVREGTISLVLRLKEAVNHGITIIVYSEYESVLEIDKDRTIHYSE